MVGSGSRSEARWSLPKEHVIDTTRLILELDTENTQASGELVTVPSRTYPIYDAVQLDLIDVRDLPPEATYPVLVRFSSAASLV